MIMKEAVKLFLGCIAYALFLRALMEYLGEHFSKSTAATIVAIIFPLGWLWLIGCLIMGAKEGFWLLKNWIAIMGGLAILSVGFILPHPAFIVLSAALAYAFYTKIAHGKSDWLI